MSERDWKELKGKTEDMMSNNKRDWYEKEAAQLMKKGAHQLAFRALKHLGTTELEKRSIGR